MFYLLGSKIGYMDYSVIRHKMEKEARQRKFREEGTYEINLSDIYSLMNERYGFSMELMELEFNTEKEFCYANPYM